jgi:two-component system NtrC family sensor kinase
MAKTKKHTLLIVDDEKPIVDSLYGLFRREYQVFTGISAEEGLEVIRREKVDVVLSDQRMSPVDGTEFLVKVKELSPDTIRILVTGYADIEAVIRAVNLGHIYGYITKPWKPDELEGLVKNAVSQLELIHDNRRLTAELRQANTGLEKKIADRTRELEDLEGYKESIISNLQSGLLVCDSDGRITSLNPAGGKILEIEDTQSWKGRHVGDHERLRYFADATDRTLSEGNLAYQEISIPLASGDTQYIGYGTSQMRAADGKVRGVIVIFRDTTEKRKFEEQIVQTEKLSAIGELAGGVAHEINNPLGVILGFTQLLLKQEWPDPVKAKLKHIESQTFRCKTIVTNLLKFARKPKVETTLVNLTQVMNDTIDILRRQLEVENISIDTRIGPGPVFVRANENELQQVFFNLIVNAKDAMDKGGRLLAKVWAEQDKGRVQLTDTGPGIPPHILEKIWNPFFTTKAPGKGTGLGLSITRTLVEKSAGAIELDSVVGEGTTFQLTFPLAGLPQEVSHGPAIVADLPPLKALRILVVDDELGVLELIREVLGEGNTLDLVHDASEAVRLLRQKTYDLVMLDLILPGFHGLDLLKVIRQDRSPEELPVVLITGQPSEGLAEHKEDLGILEIVTKPFSSTDFDEALKRAWDRHRMAVGGGQLGRGRA